MGWPFSGSSGLATAALCCAPAFNNGPALLCRKISITWGCSGMKYKAGNKNTKKT